ncbi:MAG: hypothetical protein Q7V88_11185 [Actinomycetota bacterium]|nr:hypothetical protein [Actinomycetota bacterium]
MAHDVERHQQPTSGSAHAARWAPYTRFRVVLLVTGVVPLLLVPLMLRQWPLPAHGLWNNSFVYVTGVLHVGMTSFFYLDPEMRAFRHQRPHLFVTVPLLIGVGTAAALSLLDSPGQALVNVALAAWLGWHYTGQQVGVVAMALKGEVATARLRPGERRYIKATGMVTMVGLIRTVDLANTPLANLDLLLVCRLGLVGLLAAVGWLLYRAAVEPAAGGGTWATRAVALAWATLFVAPLGLVHDPVAGAAAVAAVHSFHYVFLVAYLSRSRRPLAWVGTVLMGAATAGIYLVLLEWSPADGVLSHALPAMLFTMVAAHRVVDMRVWRLREPERLEYMRRSFVFL